MKIAIIGYGKMGKEIAALAKDKGDEVVAIIDNKNDWETQKDNLIDADIAIEFSTPVTAVDNIQQCFNINLPIVVGTTGWHEAADKLKEYAINENKTIFTASNYSIGAYIFFEINKKLAQYMNQQQQYQVSIKETHHRQKLDIPSGTSLSLALDIINNISSVNEWKSNKEVSKEYLNIESVRENNVVGIHEITYTSGVDEIKIKHEAFSRKGFAEGALMAAQWIYENNKKGWLEMKDLLGF